jgi:uncharacterized secreted protein with C-terminal beta-propeller domain
MYFTNPNIIKNFDDVKLAMVETDVEQISFYELMDSIQYRLERLISSEVDEIVSSGEVTRAEAIDSIKKRACELLRFVDEDRACSNEEDLARLIMECSLSFENWKAQIWSNFQETHAGKIRMTTQVPSTGKLMFASEGDLSVAMDELTLQGVFEVLSKYN